MATTRFTAEHVWLRPEEDGNMTVGITDYAQKQLGDVVYVELPQVEQTISPEDEAAMVESVKSTNEIRIPVGGTVIEINERLGREPEIVNSDPMGEGWFFRIEPEDTTELEGLMDENAYEEFVSGL
ncbi:MAG TPA: glycine cleavage system protein GcvH [Gammaproteobacteria bacterium]